MQVNSRNWKRLGYTAEDMLEPCKNIAAGAKLFEQAYLAELPKHRGNEQAALRAALSIYNTGNPRKGFENGYVARYFNRSR
jgi:type IV secretion system protein VirB1